jgi:23S rRNA pseudouridine1911/1915/1917 synthase
MIATRRHVGPPERFEVAARSLLGDATRRLTRRLIAAGAVTLNGRPAPKGAMVRPGDELAAPILPPLAGEPELPVTVIDVIDELIVLDKPAPMATLPLDPRERGSVASFVVGRWPRCRGVGEPLAAGIVHRLDTGSSGLVLATSSPDLWRALRRAFGAHAIEKTYAAVVAAAPPLGTIEAPLVHDRHDPRRMTTGRGRGRAWPARTEVTAAERLGTRWLVRVVLRTGVTHQVRAHLASVGAPVIGDTLYGGPADARLGDRHALHATAIEVPSLVEHVGGCWRSPLPPVFRALG